MRMIGERLTAGFAHAYGAAYAQCAYIRDELAEVVQPEKIKLPLGEGRTILLFCSELNPGTSDLAEAPLPDSSSSPAVWCQLRPAAGTAQARARC